MSHLDDIRAFFAKKNQPVPHTIYTAAAVRDIEEQRIGNYMRGGKVAFDPVICTRCGAMVLVSSTELHDKWHAGKYCDAISHVGDRCIRTDHHSAQEHMATIGTHSTLYTWQGTYSRT
jgi:hypothetical protein